MKVWQQNRKLKGTAVAVRSTIAFTKAGERFRKGLLKSAKEAKHLESLGVDWKLSALEIKEALEAKKAINNKYTTDIDPPSQITYSTSISEH